MSQLKDKNHFMDMMDKNDGRTMSNQTQPKNRPNSENQQVLRMPILYDFCLLSGPRFSHLPFEVHGGCLSEPFANEFAFSSMVRDMWKFRRKVTPLFSYERDPLFRWKVTPWS